MPNSDSLNSVLSRTSTGIDSQRIAEGDDELERRTCPTQNTFTTGFGLVVAGFHTRGSTQYLSYGAVLGVEDGESDGDKLGVSEGAADGETLGAGEFVGEDDTEGAAEG